MSNRLAVVVSGVSHHYARRAALIDVTLEVPAGEIFALLGPNGGGKSTLFRLLSTLISVQQGAIRLFDLDVQRQQQVVRSRIGVVFQSPSLDKKLTVAENIRHQAALYGMSGRAVQQPLNEMLAQLGLTDRANELTETLSGGLRRRVELAKSMIHQPQLLLLDEPSAGLDPGARSDLWCYLEQLRQTRGVTVVMTTHLLEEAEKADRLGILDAGRLVALATPDQLRATIGGNAVTIATDDAVWLAREIAHRFALPTTVVANCVRFESPTAHQWMARIVDVWAHRIVSIKMDRPSLEDVFIARTGHRFGEHDAEPMA
jgi:ABC-2 type transport system ATP-binding protein